MSHASHYTQVGTAWYTQFVNAELAEIVSHPSGNLNPYGDGHSSNSSIIALGEAWAYHIGHFFADKRYTTFCSEQNDQGFAYFNNSPINGLSSHLNLLENFNPNSAVDPFKWIPTGLFYDMIDTRNDKTAVPWTGINIDDQVSGYTNQQFFNAFSSSIVTLGNYKTNLLQQNGNNQSTQVIYLFSQYGY